MTVHQFSWEPSRPAAIELVFGRPLLFLASRNDEPSELMRAFIRLSPEGQPLSVTRLRNLSQTDLASEDRLVTDQRIAVIRSRDAGGAQTLSVFDLSGQRTPQQLDWLETAQLLITRVLEFGDTAGLGRTDLLLPATARSANVERQGNILQVSIDDRQKAVHLDALFDPQTVVDLQEGLEAIPREATPAPLLHWAADVGRHLVGARAIAWLEGQVFSWKDRFVRARYAATHEPEKAKPPQNVPQLPRPQTAKESWPEEPPPFPPQAVPSPWPHPQEGEGQWVPSGEELLGAPRWGKEPLFYETFVRPDPERPYAKHRLVIMDTSRLDLGLRAGYEDPRPRTGPPGSGHVPRDPSVYNRIVATFNGAFKATHGTYGMKAEGRVLIPPVQGAATVRIDPSGQVGMGTYRGASQEEGSLENAVAYRQNLDPLVARGELLPTGRTNWGDHLYGSSVAAERSGLCVTSDGHLIYAWSKEATGKSLSRGMQMAGCTYGMHLDMNPGHCAFTFNDIESFQPLKARGQVLTPHMQVNAIRFVRWSPKDFFYLAVRKPFPSGKAADQYEWAPAFGAEQTSHFPAIVRGTRTLAGIEIEVERIDLDQARFLLGAGTEESPKVEQVPPPKAVDAVWTLGHATRGSRPGLSIGRHRLRPMNRKYATLVLQKDGPVQLRLPGSIVEPSARTSIVQLPLLARAGELTESARRLTGLRKHGALCLDDRGYLWTGRITHDSPAPLVLALVELGCETIVEMDRGSHSPAEAHSLNSRGAAPLSSASSFIAAITRPPQPRAYEF